MIESFPAVPQKGDFIDIPEMVKALCDEQTAATFDALTWYVDYIVWCMDEKGAYPEAVCKCHEQAG